MTGVVGRLLLAVMAIADPGDAVLVPDPGWPNDCRIVHLVGARAVGFPLHPVNGFVPDLGDISIKITARTKAILFDTPCNPVGTVFPRDVLREIGVIADKTGV
jgi:aspartate/methionine/tyrosine aminotransferase